MGITYKEVIENELIERDILRYIPDKCKVCGNDIEFNDILTQVYCSNIHCPSKIAYRLGEMLKEIGIMGWDTEESLRIVQKYKLKTPYDIGGIPSDLEPILKELEDKLKKRRYSLNEVVELGKIPYISNIGKDLFSGYDDIEKFYMELLKNPVVFIKSKLGILDEGAVYIYNLLLMYKAEILLGIKYIGNKGEQEVDV